MILPSNVPVLEFHPDDRGFFCIIRYPDRDSSLVILNSNYDAAIKQFLNLVDIQTKHYQSLNILP